MEIELDAEMLWMLSEIAKKTGTKDPKETIEYVIKEASKSPCLKCSDSQRCRKPCEYRGAIEKNILKSL